MLGSGKAGRVRASAAASPARSRDMYQHYAVALYRQALLTRDDPAAAGHVADDVVASEYALPPGPERGEDDARYHLAEWVVLRCYQLVAGPAQQDRHPGIRRPRVRPGQQVPGIRRRDIAVLVRTVLRKRTTSPAAAVADGDQARGAATGRR